MKVRDNLLAVDFIFEVAHGGGEASVQGHVRVANETEPERERKRLGERLVLEDAVANYLTGDRSQHFTFRGSPEMVNAANLGFLVQLFKSETRLILDSFSSCALPSADLREHQFEHNRGCQNRWGLCSRNAIVASSACWMCKSLASR